MAHVSNEALNGPGAAGSEGIRPAESASRGVPAAFLIGAIAVLVVVVSMPRFRAHVLEANRKDAKLTLGVLGNAVFRQTASAARIRETAKSGGSLGLYELVRDVDRLDHRFPDARPTETPGELLHHGYRFATGFIHHGLKRSTALVAWPNTYGRTGDAAFATSSDGAVWAHVNRGLWSGADRPDSVQSLEDRGGSQGLLVVDLSDEGWVRLP